jgi:hypothetical protein
MKSFLPSPYQHIERVSEGVLSCESNLSRFIFYDRKYYAQVRRDRHQPTVVAFDEETKHEEGKKKRVRESARDDLSQLVSYIHDGCLRQQALT